MRLTQLALVTVMAGFAVATLGASAAAAQNGAAVVDDAAAIAQFETAINNYMALRLKLRDEISGPVPGSTAVQLTQASDALAAAIQRARSGARAGNLFVMPVTVVVKRRGDAPGVFARADNAGTMPSSRGSASDVPSPRRTVLRESAFFVMITVLPSAFSFGMAHCW